MLKKSITYEDFNGKTVTEDFYFHMSKADVIELEMEHKGGIAVWLQTAVDAEDGATILAEIKKFILQSYGKKSEDGKRFIRSKELTDEFMSTVPYSNLLFELCTDVDKFMEFFKAILPPGFEADLDRIRTQQEGARTHPSDTAASPAAPNFAPHPEADPTAVEPKLLTTADIAAMDAIELKTGLALGRYKLVP